MDWQQRSMSNNSLFVELSCIRANGASYVEIQIYLSDNGERDDDGGGVISPFPQKL